jgi:hypothetical protein
MIPIFIIGCLAVALVVLVGAVLFGLGQLALFVLEAAVWVARWLEAYRTGPRQRRPLRAPSNVRIVNGIYDQELDHG